MRWMTTRRRNPKSVGLDPTQTKQCLDLGVPKEKNGGTGQASNTKKNDHAPSMADWPYQYLGGVSNWLNSAGTFASLSPRKLGISNPSWALAAEDIVNDGTGWLSPSHQRPKAAFSGWRQ